jgi:hypothetical protein
MCVGNYGVVRTYTIPNVLAHNYEMELNFNSSLQVVLEGFTFFYIDIKYLLVLLSAFQEPATNYRLDRRMYLFLVI